MTDLDGVLGALQTRLEEHFLALRQRRNAEIGGQPIFALEHGLSEGEVDAIFDGVHAEVRNGSPRWEHRLPWTVYAAELGYQYAGDEYWQTFEERTPGWVSNGDRHWIRRCFRDFKERFGGAEPTGPWACHFNIICWPITHAILPQDLQRQFAKLLYELRHVISMETLSSPRRLGELIAGNSWGTSSRFRQLAQEPLLVGQIASALLLQGEAHGASLILPCTLERIGADLNRERRSRAWMGGARESARHQVRLATVAAPGKTSPATSDGTAPETKLCLEPRLLLWPSNTPDHEWDVLVELPDFSLVPASLPELRSVLSESRCRISGSSGRPLARGRLLYGPQQVRLHEWPEAETPLLRFEKRNSELDYLLETECNLRPGPSWLFRVAQDGLGYELRGTGVRPGCQYVLLHTTAIEADSCPSIQTTRLSCRGVHAVFVDLPDSVTPETETVLADYGLQLATTIRIWPAGLIPPKWDGEGGVEWLYGETPCVGMRADHHVEAFTIELGEWRVEATPAETGAAVFVELPKLPVGEFSLRVGTLAKERGAPGASASLDIQVRERRVWRPDNNTTGGLLVLADPHAPTLEELWGGEVALEAHGPRGRPLRCDVALYEKGAETPRVEKSLPGIRLPMNENDWAAAFESFRAERRCQNAYDVAHRCELHFSAGALGCFLLAAEREFTPVRWALRRTSQNYYLRIVDHTGEAMEPLVHHYALNTPDQEEAVDASMFRDRDGAEARGGLYVVSSGAHCRSIVIPPQLSSFADLTIEPRLRARGRRPAAIIELIRPLDRWAAARLTGDVLSRDLRVQVVESLSRQLFRLICGERWGVVEEAAAELDSDMARGTILGGFAERESSLAEGLRREASALMAGTPLDRVDCLARLAGPHFGLRSGNQESEDVRLICEFALRLASWPAGVIGWAGGNASAWLNRLIDCPGVARAARLIAVMVNCERAAHTHGRELFCCDWGWS